MLAAAVAAPLLDHRGLDLEGAERITYRLEQTFRYDYDEPVQSLRQRLVVVPPERHGDLHRRHHALTVHGVDAAPVERVEAGGNTVVDVHVGRVERHVEFRLTAVLERVTGTGTAQVPADALDDPRWRTPTALTTPDAELTAWAQRLHRTGEAPAGTAARVCAAVHERMTYRFGVTGTRTTAAQALAGGVGVCQDYAHVVLALLHELGVPARYVSGHLLGQGGTHAWVEALVADGDGAAALPFDACNGRSAGRTYVTVATGRDYADVAPTSGSYVGPPTGRLRSTRRLGVVDVVAAAA
ncbi:transglutaminase family protein [Kineococcus gypseus]|uniref:transglutaminase family protein n=1 Tax=Kineococcus gypseus TaxID=1637102 RepID=UPI003D7D4D55